MYCVQYVTEAEFNNKQRTFKETNAGKSLVNTLCMCQSAVLEKKTEDTCSCKEC